MPAQRYAPDRIRSAPACPGCRSSDLLPYPASQRSGDSVMGCRGCGLRFLGDRAKYRAKDEEFSASDTAYDYAAYVSVLRDEAISGDREGVAADLRRLMAHRPEPSLFDVGAGDGAFCSLARSAGFTVTGNEVSREAVELARERNDVELALGTLGEIGLENAHDVATMWCVLAHVEDVDELLRGCLRLLKPGGALFLQTPRWTFPDRVALSAMRASRGRLSKIVDARVSDKHWQLHTANSIGALLRRVGFIDVQAVPQARYSLNSRFYLQALGVPASLVGVGARAVDFTIAHGPAPRIVLDVTARKPG